MPEIDDLFAEVFGGQPGWISVVFDWKAYAQKPALEATARKVGSTYGLFIDHSGNFPSKA